MGLGWLVPAFLAGLAAVVVPILVHLRQREQKEPVRFPSLMFLAKVPHKTTERRRITHPWLLLLRALAVAALVAAFARPFWQQEDAPPASARASRALIVVVDRSMSMGYRGVWERALDSARAVLASAAPGDRAAIIAFDETAEVVAPLDAAAGASGALAALAPSGRGSRIAPAIRVAREVAGSARGLAVEIAVISDLQRGALTGLEAVERIPGAEMRFVAVGDTAAANTRVAEVEVDRRAEGGRTRLAVSAQLVAKGPPHDAWAALLVNGRSLATARVRLGASGTGTAQFEPVWIAEGDATGVVALEPDALPADDTLRFSLTRASGVPVTLLLPPGAGAEETLYLERALGISRSPALALTVRRGSAVPAADLARSRVVVVAEAGSLAGAAVEPLARFVEAGGGLVLVAGSRGPGPEAAAWPARLGRVVDRMTDRGGRLGQMDADHAVFDPFKEALASDFGAARFFRYRALTPDSAAQVLGRFDDGVPALVERRLGAGRIVMSALSANALWTDVPLQPVFLPLIPPE
ncbi:MAG: BatA domain-containing protein [Gemmatimonadales bacterium]